MGVIKVLGVDMRNIKKGYERRLLLNISGQAFWIYHNGVKTSNFLVAHFQEVVIKWRTTKTTISPNWKDVIRLRTLVKQFEVHIVHYFLNPN
jgi:hypothetical protein